MSANPSKPSGLSGASSDLVEVRDLHIVAKAADGSEQTIVNKVGFSIGKGEVLALIGESGSGKTTTALALMGYARQGCRIAGGQIRIGRTDVLALSPRQCSALRGRTVAYIAQSAAASFNPSMTILDQVVEAALIHKVMPRSEAKKKAIALFRDLALPDPDQIGERYPHQVSGGQLQRLMAAMALITDPALVIMDEPTTALDVTTQIEVLRAFRSVVRDRGTTAVYVTHDLAVVAQIADRIMVLRRGDHQETGSTQQIIEAPTHEYTRSLLAAARPLPHPATCTAQPAAQPLLRIAGLEAGYGRPGADGLPAKRVLYDINLSVGRGQTIGVIGESGSGKTTLARVIAGLMPPARGEIAFDGKPLPPELAHRSREQLRRIQIVFQNADTALNPAQTVEAILSRPLQLYHGLRGDALRQRVAKLLGLVQLPSNVAQRSPQGLSGGQKQRVNLARALAAEPDLILCDEVTSALDTVVGAAILELMAELRRELGVSYLFISHDLNTVRSICDEVVVMYAGRIVEVAPRDALTHPPHHPYAELLSASVPQLRLGWLDALAVKATEAGAGAPAAGCPFFDRCPVRIQGVCDAQTPPRRQIGGEVEVLCHHTGEALLALASAASEAVPA
ncbi:ABC transporter ATP-binding protein [Cupriavidus basilensis]|uniref:ABC transporter ATP-binding protein n=1 Tax=Cupriavidus basilensis TaxID=68895 RepID=UPI00157B7C8D|nr:ABC transporter ATP-binding protein [Cupriavidus basilensis]NUA28466.1 ABC transporter ATP-binding protein [Cupriavidus basilensis]